MKWWIRLILGLVMFATMPAAAWERDLELLPMPTGGDERLPPCRLTRTETELVLSLGDREIQRLRHRSGANIVEVSDQFDRNLLVALSTVRELRASGACR